MAKLVFGGFSADPLVEESKNKQKVDNNLLKAIERIKAIKSEWKAYETDGTSEKKISMYLESPEGLSVTLYKRNEFSRHYEDATILGFFSHRKSEANKKRRNEAWFAWSQGDQSNAKWSVEIKVIQKPAIEIYHATFYRGPDPDSYAFLSEYIDDIALPIIGANITRAEEEKNRKEAAEKARVDAKQGVIDKFWNG